MLHKLEYCFIFIKAVWVTWEFGDSAIIIIKTQHLLSCHKHPHLRARACAHQIAGVTHYWPVAFPMNCTADGTWLDNRSFLSCGWRKSHSTSAAWEISTLTCLTPASCRDSSTISGLQLASSSIIQQGSLLSPADQVIHLARRRSQGEISPLPNDVDWSRLLMTRT